MSEREVHGATTHGIQYFSGSLPMLLVETCQRIRIEEGGEVRNLEVGDTYMDKKIQDIFRKTKGESTGFEILLEEDQLEEDVELNGDNVVAWSRRHVTESELLRDDLEDAPNWNPGDEEDE